MVIERALGRPVVDVVRPVLGLNSPSLFPEWDERAT